MRCPKCGYNSFDHLQSCKKCGKDLTEHKSRFGLSGVLLSNIFTKSAESVEAAEPEASPDSAEQETTVPEPAAEEAPPAITKNEDLDFDFNIESEEEKELVLDDFFEDTPQGESQEEETASPPPVLEEPATEEEPARAESIEPDSAHEDDPFLTSDNELSLDAPDLGLDEAGDPAETVSEATELGLDDTDFAALSDDDFSGDEEDPDHPFGSEEDLHSEDSSTIELGETFSAPDQDEPIDFLTDLQPSPAEPDTPPEIQEDLFPVAAELPPLPDTKRPERPLESLETTYAGTPLEDTAAGASDDFSLGALPVSTSNAAASTPQAGVEPPHQPALEQGEDESPAPAAEEEGLHPASSPPALGRRLSALICDILLIGLVGLCFIIVAETALSERSTGILPTLDTLIDLSIPYFLVLFCLTFGYFTLFHFLTGQTPGKMLTDMRVETASGEAIAFSQAFMRSVGGLIQLLPIGLGYLTILNREGRGWNDRLAGTRLIDLKSGEEEDVEEEIPSAPTVNTH